MTEQLNEAARLMNERSLRLQAIKYEVDDLFLYAINTGELYETHCKLARECAQPQDWLVHADKVVRRYQREIKMAYRPSTGVTREVAEELRHYYEKHVNEEWKA